MTQEQLNLTIIRAVMYKVAEIHSIPFNKCSMYQTKGGKIKFQVKEAGKLDKELSKQYHGEVITLLMETIKSSIK